MDIKWLKPPLLLAAANIMRTLLPPGKQTMFLFFNFFASFLHKTENSRQLKWKSISTRYRWGSFNVSYQVNRRQIVCHGVIQSAFYQTGEVCTRMVPEFLKMLHVYLWNDILIYGSFEMSKQIREWRDWVADWSHPLHPCIDQKWRKN